MTAQSRSARDETTALARADFEPAVDHIDIDDVFTGHVGEMGKHQKWLFFVASLPWWSGAFLTYNLNFAGKDPIDEHLWHCTDPDDALCAEVHASDAPGKALCTLPRTAWAWTAPGESVVSEFGLICDRLWLNQLANSAFFLGFLIGAAVWGAASDKYGRRATLIASLAISGVVTGFSGLAMGYTSMFISRILQGSACAGVGLISFTLACELVGPSWRGSVGVATQFFWCGGECMVPLLAWLVPNWRAFTALCGVSVIVPLLAAPWIPESPRWLLSKGRGGESSAVLAKMAAGNGTLMPPQPLLVPPPRAESTLWDTFRVRELRRRQCVMMTCWCVVSLAYYGVSLALDSLGGDLYLKFFFVALIEFPAYFFAMMLLDRTGRRSLTVFSFGVCGASCLLCALLPGDGAPTVRALRVAAAVGGKFGGASAFILLYVYTIELFPTVVRNAALGANSSSARLGGVIAPLIVLVAAEMNAAALSFAVFGITSMLAGALCMLMPETQGKPLADTIEDIQGFSNYDADEYMVASRVRRESAALSGRGTEAASDAFLPHGGAGDERFVLTEEEAPVLDAA